MIRQIEDKLCRLDSARTEKANALNHIRCELTRALKAESGAPERHEHRKA